MIDLAHMALIGICLFLIALNLTDRRRAGKREDQLVKAVMANNLTEYHHSLVTPKDRIREMKTESQLAESAYKLERDKIEEGIPVG
jgi:hypothetical protein